MKCSLGISDFLEEIPSLSHSIFFLYFFALILYLTKWLLLVVFFLVHPWKDFFAITPPHPHTHINLSDGLSAVQKIAGPNCCHSPHSCCTRSISCLGSCLSFPRFFPDSTHHPPNIFSSVLILLRHHLYNTTTNNWNLPAYITPLYMLEKFLFHLVLGKSPFFLLCLSMCLLYYSHKTCHFWYFWSPDMLTFPPPHQAVLCDTSRVSCNSAQYLPGDDVRSHKLRAWSHETVVPPTPSSPAMPFTCLVTSPGYQRFWSLPPWIWLIC